MLERRWRRSYGKMPCDERSSTRLGARRKYSSGANPNSLSHAICEAGSEFNSEPTSELTHAFGLSHTFEAPRAFWTFRCFQSSRVSLTMSHTPRGQLSCSNGVSSYIDIKASTFERIAISLPFDRHIPFSPYPVTVTSCHTPLTPYPVYSVFQLKGKSLSRRQDIEHVGLQ